MGNFLEDGLLDNEAGDAAGVQSVNGQTGTVTLAAADVGAAPTSHTHNASQINAGTLDPARLPAGSAMTGTAPTIADAADAPTVEEFNGLLAALRARGVIA